MLFSLRGPLSSQISGLVVFPSQEEVAGLGLPVLNEMCERDLVVVQDLPEDSLRLLLSRLEINSKIQRAVNRQYRMPRKNLDG